MKILLALFCLAALTASAADKPYNESADARQDIKQALATATNTPVMVIFGANWCPDCLALDRVMHQEPSASLLKRDFKIVKVDAGQKDKNVDLAASYGVYYTNGIPSVVILSPANKILYVTREGELRHARDMGDDSIYQFFKGVVTTAKKK